METFIEKMNRLFGSDEALGVTFEIQGDVLTPSEYEAMRAKVGINNMPEAISYLPTGGSAICCTDYARLIQRNLSGEHEVKVVGFANEDNPTSRVAREEIHPGGHDFAWVDDRYIVDPWLTLVACVGTQFVFDSQDSTDAALMLDIYGPQHCWGDLDQPSPECDNAFCM